MNETLGALRATILSYFLLSLIIMNRAVCTKNVTAFGYNAIAVTKNVTAFGLEACWTLRIEYLDWIVIDCLTNKKGGGCFICLIPLLAQRFQSGLSANLTRIPTSI
jgi:hypothetical protein